MSLPRTECFAKRLGVGRDAACVPEVARGVVEMRLLPLYGRDRSTHSFVCDACIVKRWMLGVFPSLKQQGCGFCLARLLVATTLVSL